MSFLYPAFLLAAIAAAIPIALHVRGRATLPAVPFSAVRLIASRPLEQTRRWRLRELLLLAARVAALLLLATAFARPYFADAAAPLHVVAIDRSFSMAAPGLFARALQQAGQAIDSSAQAPVALVAFDDRAEVIAEPGAPGEARAALDRVRPGFGGTRYEPVFATAVTLAAGAPLRLTIVSDLQRVGWQGEQPLRTAAGMTLEVVDAGAAVANTWVERARRDAGGVIATIGHDGPQGSTGSVRLISEGREVASRPYEIPAAGSVEVRIPLATKPVQVVVEVEDAADTAGGLPADNRRYLILDGVRPAGVLMIGSDIAPPGFFITRALETVSGPAAFDVHPAASVSVGRLSDETFDRYGALVLLSTRGLDRRGRERVADFVRRGGGLVVVASPDIEPAVVETMMGWGLGAVERAGARSLTATDGRHPIFRPFGANGAVLGQVRFTRVWSVEEAGWDVAARFNDGMPALLERRDGRGRVLLFTSDLDRRWNDFPVHAAFVPFVVESVGHVLASKPNRREYLVGQVPAGVKREPGLYTLPSGQPVAVNVDAAESRVARLTPAAFKAMASADLSLPGPSARRAALVEGRQSLWRYGLILMLAALVVESIAGRSR